MENQHRQIKGYRELTEREIAVMNMVKDHGRLLGELIEKLETSDSDEMSVDKRWLAIAKTDLQKGMMSLTRAIARPDFF